MPSAGIALSTDSPFVPVSHRALACARAREMLTLTATRERHETKIGNIRHSAISRHIHHNGLGARSRPRALRDLVYAAGAGEIRPWPGDGAFILLSEQRPGLHGSSCRRSAMRHRLLGHRD